MIASAAVIRPAACDAAISPDEWPTVATGEIFQLSSSSKRAICTAVQRGCESATSWTRLSLPDARRAPEIPQC